MFDTVGHYKVPFFAAGEAVNDAAGYGFAAMGEFISGHLQGLLYLLFVVLLLLQDHPFQQNYLRSALLLLRQSILQECLDVLQAIAL